MFLTIYLIGAFLTSLLLFNQLKKIRGGVQKKHILMFLVMTLFWPGTLIFVAIVLFVDSMLPPTF